MSRTVIVDRLVVVVIDVAAPADISEISSSYKDAICRTISDPTVIGHTDIIHAPGTEVAIKIHSIGTSCEPVTIKRNVSNATPIIREVDCARIGVPIINVVVLDRHVATPV